MTDLASFRSQSKLSQAELAAKIGVNQATVSRLERGELTPTRPLAIHIFRCTGWKHPRLADLSDEQIAMLEGIEPWQGAEAA